MFRISEDPTVKVMGIERAKMCKKLVQMVRPGLGFKSSPQTDFSFLFYFTCSNANDTGQLRTFLQLTKMTNVYSYTVDTYLKNFENFTHK